MNIGLIKTGLRTLQLLCCLIGTAMIGNVIAENKHGSGDKTAAIGFAMAAYVFAWFGAIYGMTGRLMNSLEFPTAVLLVDGFAILFTFIASIMLAGLLKVVNCGSLDPKKLPKNYIAWGSDNDEKRCRELQAGTAFMWFLLLSFIPTAFFAFRDRKSHGGSWGTRSVGSGPTMSQVRGV
jgi:non-classical export protein 2